MQIQLLAKEGWQIAARPTLRALAQQPSFANGQGFPLREALNCQALRIVLEGIAIVFIVTRDPIDGETTGPSTVQAIRSMNKIERQADGSLRVYVISTALAERFEVWIDEGERRTWFLFETMRRARDE